MPKRRQVPRLFSQTQASGNTFYYWKPEKRLRMLGWKNHALGPDQIEATAEAVRLNKRVAESAKARAPETIKHKLTFGELLDRYLASSAFQQTSANTQKDYRLRCRELREWALDGAVAVDKITEAMIETFTEQCLQSVSKSVAASRLRTLRVVLNWARKKGGLSPKLKRHCRDLSEAIEVPSYDKRKVKLDWPTVETAAADADAKDCPITGAALRIGFWSCQRQGDLLGLTRFTWKEILNVDPRDRAILTGPNGKVMGFHISEGQNKTDTPVVCPMPPFLHAEIEQRFQESSFLFHAPGDTLQQAKSDWFGKKVNRTMRAAGVEEAVHKDMRRSGMSWLRSLGAAKADIHAVSGHITEAREKMDDVYMPHDPRDACRAIATALRAMKEIEEREQEAER